MNKDELVRKISEDEAIQVSQDTIRRILNCGAEVIRETLEKGEPFKWVGLGTLSVRVQPPRKRYFVHEKCCREVGTKRTVVFHQSENWKLD